MGVRLVLLVPFLYLILKSTKESGSLGCIFIIIVIIALDLLDGRYAARKNLDTPKRRIADSVADKITAHTILLSTVLHYDLSLWLYLPLLFRDFLSMATSLRLLRLCIVYYPNALHKLAVALLGLASCFLFSGDSDKAIPFLIGAYGLYYFSLIDQLGSSFLLPITDDRRPCREYGEYHPGLFDGIKAIFASPRPEAVAMRLRYPCGSHKPHIFHA